MCRSKKLIFSNGNRLQVPILLGVVHDGSVGTELTHLSNKSGNEAQRVETTRTLAVVQIDFLTHSSRSK